MTSALENNVYTFDRKLLARMTGALGDNKTIGKLSADLGQVFTEFLPDIFQNETGLDIEIAYGGFDTGLRSELIARLGNGVALCDTTLRNWCPDFVISCDSPVIITLMEVLLGAPPTGIEEPKPRNLSTIELDVATMVFEKIAEVLKSAVNAPGGFEPTLSRPMRVFTLAMKASLSCASGGIACAPRKVVVTPISRSRPSLRAARSILVSVTRSRP